MGTALTVLIVLVSILVFVVLVSYIVMLIAAHQLKKKTEEFMTKKGIDILNRGVDAGITKFQQKVNQAIEKKNQKKL